MARIRPFSLFLLSAILLIAACGTDEAKEGACLPEGTTAANQARLDEALPGSYIVNFRNEPGGAGLHYPSFLAETTAHVTAHESLLRDPRVKDFRFLTAIDLARPENASWVQEFDPPPALRLAWRGQDEALTGSLMRVDFDDDAVAREVLSEWDERGALWYAEPNYVSRLSQDENLFEKYEKLYEGLSYWWIDAIKLVDAYKSLAQRPQGEAGVPTDAQILANQPIIAVLDSGIDYTHPALQEQMWVNSDVGAARCSNDIHGCNTTTADRDRLGDGDIHPYGTSKAGESCLGKDPNCSHGTHVAGIIAGDPEWSDPDGRRAAGICPICRIMALRIVGKVDKKSGILDSSILAAFKYVALFKRKGSSAVRVINASFGKFNRSRSVGLMVRLLKEKNGAIVIGAAGNEDTLSMEYPAAFADAIAVSAVDSNLRKVDFSNFGRWVDISAPGQGILSTVPGAGLDFKSGTSMAAPMVAAVAGLMIARYPDIDYDSLRFWLLNSTDPKFYQQSHAGGYNYHCYYPKISQEDVRQPLLGTGLLQANQAIRRVISEGLPLYTELDRVKQGCSVVAVGAAGRPWLFITLLMLPLLVVFRASKSS